MRSPNFWLNSSIELAEAAVRRWIALITVSMFLARWMTSCATIWRES